MDKIRAVVTDPGSAGHLILTRVDPPQPALNQALVRVEAFSLNRGEVRNAFAAQTSYTPGWDVAGTVERAAVDGSGPAAGARVVGLLNTGGWSELAAAPTSALAELPESLSFQDAATLPVAGLTALLALEKGGSLLGRRVLVTGASGGVGLFAIQLARRSGAFAVGLNRQARYQPAVREAGADQAVSGEDASPAAPYGPYDLILDSVGGNVLGTALGLLAPGGVCVSYGATTGQDVAFKGGPFFRTGGLSLYGLYVFYEVRSRSASERLARLAGMVAGGLLRPRIEQTGSWETIAETAQRLMNREYLGKAVLFTHA